MSSESLLTARPILAYKTFQWYRVMDVRFCNFILTLDAFVHSWCKSVDKEDRLCTLLIHTQKKKLSSKMSLWRLAQHVCKVRTHFKPRSSLLGKVRFLLPWFVFILPMLELDLWAVGLTVSGLVGTRLTYDLPGAEGHIVDPPLSEARIVTWGEKKTMVQWTESKKRNNNNSYVKDRTT